MKKYREAIELLNNSLIVYPACTDMEYVKGLVFWDWKRYTLAIASFEKAIAMGESPKSLRFTDHCATIKPLFSLGKIYAELYDYQKALEYFQKILQIDSGLYFVLYEIAKVYSKIYVDKHEIEKKMAAYFGSLEHLPNVIILCDILLKLGLYSFAEKYIIMMRSMPGYESEKCILKGIYCFYTQDYKKSLHLLDTIIKTNKAEGLLIPDSNSQTVQYLLASSLLASPQNIEIVDKIIMNSSNSKIESKVYKQISSVFYGEEKNEIQGIADEKKGMQVLEKFLSIILKSGNFDLFEKLLYVYNYFESKQVLVSLAAVYLENGLTKFAIDNVVRSINELNTIDDRAVGLLYAAYYE